MPLPALRHRELFFYPVVGLIALLVAAALGANALPGEFRVAKSRFIDALPETVFDTLARPVTWKEFWPRESSDLRAVRGAPAFGRGAAAERRTAFGTVEVLRIVSFEAARRVRYEREAEGLPLAIKGEFLLEPEGDGTRVTWTVRGEDRGSLYARIPLVFADEILEPDLAGALESLARLVEERP